jgi:hypothetical protein
VSGRSKACDVPPQFCLTPKVLEDPHVTIGTLAVTLAGQLVNP